MLAMIAMKALQSLVAQARSAETGPAPGLFPGHTDGTGCTGSSRRSEQQCSWNDEWSREVPVESRFPRFLTNGKSLIHNHLHRVTAITAARTTCHCPVSA